MEYIAHQSEDHSRKQTIQEHCQQTAGLAGRYAIQPAQAIVEAAATLHDVGKYQPSFQARMRDPSIRAPHAFCGAQAAKERYGMGCAGMMMAYVIAGHHAGLPDYGSKADIASDATLCANLIRPPEDYAAYRAELEPPPLDEAAFMAYIGQDCQTPDDASERFAFFTRYCFSCLTDADSLNTEAFCDGRERQPPRADIAACLARVDERLSSFQCETPLQKARAGLQRQAFDKAGTDAHIYLMSMPTGSGKTLCSLRFALQRAIATGKRRLVYIIPYNAIIDQTADEFERVLGDSAVILRHQSTYLYEDDKTLSEEELLRRTKATENWDAPIIITTVVQFFESIYGDKRGKLRRLHNLQDAVLVFDEAHLLPRAYLQPCLKGIALLTRYLRSEAVLLTATMPDYAALLARYGLPGLKTVDLVPDRSSFAMFRKCRFASLGALSDEALLARAASAPSCLVVVNSRKAARALYAACPAGRKYHLSTWMTAIDRERVISEIRQALADMERSYPALADVPVEERLTVISTSLIEAGIDLDFHTVMRELTGLDSILQAGGRCNREGRRPTAVTYVFEREDSLGKRDMDARVGITRELLARFESIDSPECIAAYYERLFAAHEDELASRSIVRFARDSGVYDPKRPLRLPFRSYARSFRMIDAPTYAIAVPRDDTSRALIARLPCGLPASDIRRLQKYCCSVTPRDFSDLLSMGLVGVSSDGFCFLKAESAYDPNTGIRFECQDTYL